MKKLITLLAVAFLAVTANAQLVVPLTVKGTTDTVRILESSILQVEPFANDTDAVVFYLSPLKGNTKVTVEEELSTIKAATETLIIVDDSTLLLPRHTIAEVKAKQGSATVIGSFANGKKRLVLQESPDSVQTLINAL